MYLKRTLLFLGLSIYLLLVSTNISSGQPICGFDERLKELIETNPDYAQKHLMTEQSIQNYIAKHPHGSTNARSVAYTIPVVLHVMHTGGAIGSPYNPTDATLQGFITISTRFTQVPIQAWKRQSEEVAS
ncbi:MAG: hypothetical protein IPL46_04340 [Saprospiraceae bacterium]|nr:hypothetical protein [Saprospiraceae bacterium]